MKRRPATLAERAAMTGQRSAFVGGSVVAAGTNADLVDLWHPGLLRSGPHRPNRQLRRVARPIEGASRAAGDQRARPDPRTTVRHAALLLGIATNDSEAGARATAAALGLSDLFHTIIGYDSVARPKPWPDQLAPVRRPHRPCRPAPSPWWATIPTISKWPMPPGPASPSGCSRATARAPSWPAWPTSSWTALPICRRCLPDVVRVAASARRSPARRAAAARRHRSSRASASATAGCGRLVGRKRSSQTAP